MEVSFEKWDNILRLHACQRPWAITVGLMWDLILESGDEGICQYDSAGRLGVLVLLITTILAARWGIPHAIGLCRKIEDFANLCSRVLKSIWKLGGNLSYKDVDRERGSAKRKSAAVSTLLFGGELRAIYFSYMTLTT